MDQEPYTGLVHASLPKYAVGLVDAFLLFFFFTSIAWTKTRAQLPAATQVSVMSTLTTKKKA